MQRFTYILFILLVVSSIQAQPPLLQNQVVLRNCGISLASLNITATGDSLGAGDDAWYPVTLPFNFTFPGGTTTNMIIVSTNGYLSSDITDNGQDWSNDCPIPFSPNTGGGARIYILHDDLELESALFNGAVYYQALNVAHPTLNGLTSCVIYYDNVNHFNNVPGTWDMAIVLYSNGDYIFVYGPGNAEDGSGSTTGVQNLGATQGTVFLPCDTGSQGLGTTLQSICVLGAPGGTPIPTLGTWLIIILGLSFLILGTVKILNLRKAALA